MLEKETITYECQEMRPGLYKIIPENFTVLN